MTKITSIPKSELAKASTAFGAVRYVKDGMRLGLGTGSTAAWFVKALADRIAREGITLRCVTTSSETWALAESLGIELTTLEEMPEIDLVIDGADEVSPNLELIKGGGAALLQEKIVAAAAREMIVIADAGKLVPKLGTFHLPVEVVRFGWNVSQMAIEALLRESDVKAVRTERRMKNGEALVTDEGHYIIDCFCEEIGAPAELSAALNQIPGVVENGLFIDLATKVVVGDAEGQSYIVTREGAEAPAPAPIPSDIEITSEKD